MLFNFSHGSLRRLAMNATGASGWSNIERLGTMFPNLEELYLADNDMRDLPFILDESDDNSCSSTHAKGSETAAHSFVTGIKILLFKFIYILLFNIYLAPSML